MAATIAVLSQKGGTGYGVRLIVELATRLSNA